MSKKMGEIRYKHDGNPERVCTMRWAEKGSYKVEVEFDDPTDYARFIFFAINSFSPIENIIDDSKMASVK